MKLFYSLLFSSLTSISAESSPQELPPPNPPDQHFTSLRGFSFPGKLLSTESEWVQAHNIRRERIHKSFGESYVPVQWDNSMATEANEWATYIASICQMKHTGDSYYGENIYAGNGPFSPEVALNSWVEGEEHLPWGDRMKRHYTAVVWRSTRYIGCASVQSSCPDRWGAYVYTVCRYTGPPNWGLDRTGNNWKKKMLEKKAHGGSACPKDGCHQNGGQNRDCENKDTRCDGWAQYCIGQYYGYMSENCKKTCGLCGGGGISLDLL